MLDPKGSSRCNTLRPVGGILLPLPPGSMQEHKQPAVRRPLGADVPGHHVDVILQGFGIVAMPLRLPDMRTELAANRDLQGLVTTQIGPPLFLKPRLQGVPVRLTTGNVRFPVRELVRYINDYLHVQSPLRVDNQLVGALGAGRPLPLQTRQLTAAGERIRLPVRQPSGHYSPPAQ